jgi:hypothetical protein
LLPKLQHSRLSLTGVAAFGRDVYHADYQELVKFLPFEFAREKFHNKLLMCKLHITPIHKHKRHQLLHRFPFTLHGRWPTKLILPMSALRRLADATRSFFRADGNDATDRHSLATIIAAITTDLPLSTF